MATSNNSINILILAKDEASKVLKNVGSEMESTSTKTGTFSKSLGNMASVAGGIALARIASEVLDFGRNALTSASNFEQSRLAFETMLGSADEAKSLLKDISKFARETPFELPEVVEGSKRLLAYNIEAGKLLPTLEGLGNIAAGVGKEKLPQLILAFGQVRAAGKLTGMELRQFTEAGVPLLELLARQSGKSAAEIKDAMENGAAPSFEEVERAIFSASQEGGRFEGLMKKQSKSLGGIASNIKDSLGQIGRAALGLDVEGNIREGSIFAVIKQAAEGAMPVLQELSERVGPAIASFLERAGELGRQVWSFLEPSFQKLGKTLKDKLFPSLKKLWKEVIEPLLPVIGVALVGAVWLVVNALESIVKTSSAVISVFSTLAGWFNNVQDTARGLALDVLGVFKDIALTIKGVWDDIYAVAVKPVLDVIVGAVSGAVAAIKFVWDTLVAITSFAWQSVYAVAKPYIDALQTAMSAIVAPIQAAWSGMTGWFNTHIWQPLATGFGSLASKIAQSFSAGMSTSMAIVKDTVREAVNWVSDKLNFLIRGYNSIASKIPGAPKVTEIPRLEGNRASGGPVLAGKAYKVNERVPEVFVPHQSGKVVPLSESQPTGGQTTNNFNIYNNVDVGLVVRELSWSLAIR